MIYSGSSRLSFREELKNAILPRITPLTSFPIAFKEGVNQPENPSL